MILEVAILNIIPGWEDDFLKAFSEAKEIISKMARLHITSIKKMLKMQAALYYWLSGKNLPTIRKGSEDQKNTRNGKGCYIIFMIHFRVLNITNRD